MDFIAKYRRHLTQKKWRNSLKKLKRFIKGTILEKKISLKKADLRKIMLSKNSFDLVVCTSTFHELNSKSLAKLIEQAKGATKKFGINYFAFFLSQNTARSRKEGYYLQEEEILEKFADWKVLKKETILIKEKHQTPYSQGVPVEHTHLVCHLILQKNQTG